MKGSCSLCDRRAIGLFGEEAVCDYLQSRGYGVVCRNFRTRGGEIDIIASNEDILAFVEVKTRPRDSLTSGFDAVNMAKRRRIVRTAIAYLSTHKAELQPRFDVAQVTLAPMGRNTGRTLVVEDLSYLENAFDTTGLFMVL